MKSPRLTGGLAAATLLVSTTFAAAPHAAAAPSVPGGPSVHCAPDKLCAYPKPDFAGTVAYLTLGKENCIKKQIGSAANNYQPPVIIKIYNNPTCAFLGDDDQTKRLEYGQDAANFPGQSYVIYRDNGGTGDDPE